VDTLGDDGVDAGVAAQYAAMLEAAATAQGDAFSSTGSHLQQGGVENRTSFGGGALVVPLAMPDASTPRARTPSPFAALSSPQGTPVGAVLATSGVSPLTTPSLLAITVDVIEFDDLQLGRLLGSGSEGAVYAAWYLETPVAVKRFNKVDDSVHEIGMFLGVGSHDNVVALRALCQHEDAMYLVLEYCPR